MKQFLKECRITKAGYQALKSKRDKKIYDKASDTEKKFINRSHNKEILCIILAGYKSFAYKAVFGRLEKYMPDNMDICIVSSGVYSEELSDIAEKNGWSYLSLKRNCVTLAQNTAIRLHEKAEYIFKLDEDIFVTENCFETVLETFKQVEKAGDYEVGFAAPLIPINGYGHLRILEKLNLKEAYQTKFEKPLYISRPDRMIENNTEAARYFWGSNGEIPDLDILNQICQRQEFHFSICPIRFSIGFILIKRQLWSEMGMYPVRKGSCMGLDEEWLCGYCMVHSKAIIVAENAVVGHLSFGKQNDGMKEYFIQHPEIFMPGNNP